MMHLGEAVRMAWNSIRSGKLRSVLTMLGIIIGIAAVIGITTVGNGLSHYVMDSMSSLGANNVTFTVQARHGSGTGTMDVGSMMSGGSAMREKDRVTDHMIRALRDRYSSEIASVGLSETAGSAVAMRHGKQAKVTLTGINADYLSIETVKILAGRSLSSRENRNQSHHAVVSDKLVKQLLGGSNRSAIGKTIRMKMDGTTYRLLIVGVYRYEEMEMGGRGGQSAQNGSTADSDLNTALYVPIDLAKSISGAEGGYSYFTVKTKAGTDSEAFAKRAEKYLNHAFYHGNDAYHITSFSMDTMLETMNTMMQKIELALAVIAGISLLVGGIGVMNIMLVSVTERTREIGIRKALGATNGNIRAQFAVESILLCLIGGVIGIVLGGVLGHAGSALLGFTAYPTVKSVLMAFGVSAAIGIFFGLYPANRAAKMDPIDALRYE